MAVVHEKPYLLTTVGKKLLMGISGLVWAGFVFAHMAGNLLLLVGANAFNAYGHALTSGYFIYAAETVLILALIVHVVCAISLTKENRAAGGGQRYAMPTNGAKAVSKASKTMAIQGSVVLFFLISHIASMKYGTYYETTVGGVVMRDLHRLVMETFKQPGFVVFYLISLIFLGVHLSHGIGSTFQSLGLRNDHFAPLIRKISLTYAVVVCCGFIIQPIYVYFIAG